MKNLSIKIFIFFQIFFSQISSQFKYDFCQIEPKFCIGNLGISRKQMTQLNEKDKSDYLAKNPNAIECIMAKDLIPIQNEADYNKILSMINFGPKICEDNPILISNNNYILDGHHRVFSCGLMNQSISVYRMLNIYMNATSSIDELVFHLANYFT